MKKLLQEILQDNLPHRTTFHVLSLAIMSLVGILGCISVIYTNTHIITRVFCTTLSITQLLTVMVFIGTLYCKLKAKKVVN